MKQTDRIQLLSSGQVSRSLFKLGLPTAVSMLVVALYNVVDTYFIAGLGTIEVAAISVAFPLSLVFSGIGLCFGIGSGSFISRYLGAGKKDDAEITASTAAFSSLAAAALLAAIFCIFITPIMRFLGATEAILPHALEYGRIFVISLILSSFTVTCGNIAVAEGASDISLTAMIAGALINIGLDPVFIYTLDFGVAGAAAASLVAQIISACIYLVFFNKRQSNLKIKPSFFRPSIRIYADILKLGISMLLLQLLTSLSISLLSRSASFYGAGAVAAIGIMLRITSLGTNVVFGYLKGFQPMAGFNYGAGNIDRLQKAASSCIKSTTVFCLIWTAVVFIFGDRIISLFSNDPYVVQSASKALKINSIMFFSFGFQFTFSTLYIAIGRALPGGFLNICRQGVFFIPAAIILPRIFGFTGLIYAQPVADLLTTAVTFILAGRLRKNLGT